MRKETEADTTQQFLRRCHFIKSPFCGLHTLKTQLSSQLGAAKGSFSPCPRRYQYPLSPFLVVAALARVYREASVALPLPGGCFVVFEFGVREAAKEWNCARSKA